MIFEVVNDVGFSVFFSFSPLGCSFQGLDGQSDPSSIHGGCEVLAGEKWSATKWMRQRAAN